MGQWFQNKKRAIIIGVLVALAAAATGVPATVLEPAVTAVYNIFGSDTTQASTAPTQSK